MSHQELADTIANARKTREQCDVTWPAPAATDSALAIQSEVVAAHGSPVKGWKVGATNATAQKNFGLDGPFFGPMVEAGFADDGATLPAAPTVLAVEPEYAFKMARINTKGVTVSSAISRQARISGVSFSDFWLRS